MYYSKEEMSIALEKAKLIVEEKSKKVKRYIRSYNCCWSLVKEYDKALRGTSLPDIDFSFDTHEEFFEKLKYSLEELATNVNYEIIESKKSKPIIKSYADNFLS